MSAPISITTPTFGRVSPSVASSPGLYIPVHRRTDSRNSSSSRSSSSTRSESERSTHAPSQFSYIYSRETLLNLANSPLSRIPTEKRELLRESCPEIMTNRKQRKAIEHRNQNQNQNQNQDVVRPVTARRTRHVERTSEKRSDTSKASKVVDEASWRGRRPALAAIAL